VAGFAAAPQWLGLPLLGDGCLLDPQLPYAVSETDLEAASQRALRGPRIKLIRTAGLDRRPLPDRALFDLQGDAREQVNLAAQQGEREGDLEAELTRARDGDLWR
jgi:hypothetical protein